MKLIVNVDLGIVILAAVACLPVGAEAAESPSGQELPVDWLVRWHRPPVEDRPLQIVHGIDPRRAMPGLRHERRSGAPDSAFFLRV